MAFEAHGSHTNLPNGVFSPTLYSKKVQLAFRKSSIVQDITNTDYFGEIKNYGDTVQIIKEPDISVIPYTRGAPHVVQDIVDEDFSLTVTESNMYAFGVEDIEKQQSHVNWESLASDQAGYKLKDQHDQEVLGYMCGFKQSALHSVADTARVLADIPGTKADTAADDDELLAKHKLTTGSFGDVTNPTHSIPLDPAGGSGVVMTPLRLLNRMSRLMDQANVQKEGRWIVLDPIFIEMLMDEDSKLINGDYSSTDNVLKNGKVCEGKIRGFRVYESNNMPSVGTGADTTASVGSATDYGVILAGIDSAVATAEQINKTESFRSQTHFKDVVRGLHLYGRKILRPEGLVRAKYNVA